jgi:putative endonuclease
MPAYIYILRCADGGCYYGSTSDLRERLDRHHAGLVRSTQWRRPVKLVWFDVCETLAEARRGERSLKNGRTRRKAIELMIARFPASRLAPYA